MGLFGFFSGKKPEDIEKKGDEFYEQGVFGYAKMEYEKARERHLAKPSEHENFGQIIVEKIQKACEGLALGHRDKAKDYIEENSGAEFSHGLCAECLEKYYPEPSQDEEDEDIAALRALSEEDDTEPNT